MVHTAYLHIHPRTRSHRMRTLVAGCYSLCAWPRVARWRIVPWQGLGSAPLPEWGALTMGPRGPVRLKLKRIGDQTKKDWTKQRLKSETCRYIWCAVLIPKWAALTVGHWGLSVSTDVHMIIYIFSQKSSSFLFGHQKKK